MKQFFSKKAEGLFLSCDRGTYWNYRHFGLSGEEFQCRVPGGEKICGLYLPADVRPGGGAVQGTVLYFYPCERNYQFHLPQISWLVAAGWGVVLFDYRGAGRSEGVTTLQGIAEDGHAVLSFLRSREDIDTRRLVFFGQGPGADAALRVLSLEPDAVAGVILESPYATRAGWLVDRYGRVVGRCAAMFLPRGIEEPVDAVAGIRSPLAVVVVEKDVQAPPSQVKALVDAAPRSREVWHVEGAMHLTVFSYPCIWRERFLEFARDAVDRRLADESSGGIRKLASPTPVG